MKKTNVFTAGYYDSHELSEMGFAFVGQSVQVAKNCTIIGLENISIGDNVRIDGGTTLACANGQLHIGSYVHIGAHCYLACGAGIQLHDFSGLSQGVKIYSTSDDYSGSSLTNPTVPSKFLNVNEALVQIGRHVIVGSGSVILPGVTINEGSSVGALSLVSKNLDAWGVYSGVPAKRLKDRKRDLLEQEKALLSERAHPLPKF
ncbi:acyltransferase [Roseovarius sp. MMSF_3281]|uniref:acyltransferase n=1 Tax=Roseovarius sp. MMSF_3281 TaxID=3046694 RepID=UPI00273EEAF4|nr:acyltransferase [Roseovarius sp. MMSF_3281]